MPDQGDTTPQEVEAKQAVLGALLRDNAGVDLMGRLARPCSCAATPD